jgi:predicted nucleotidyltransferase
MISLRSKITQKILNLFFLNDKEKFYINELADIIKEDPTNVYKKLMELRQEGLLSDEFQGKERYFSLNKQYALLKEYKKIILREIGFEMILKEELTRLKGIESVYIFGSYANGNFSQESDIDILVIGDFENFLFQKTILKIQELTSREINSVTFAKQEFNRRNKRKDPFLEDIFNKKYIKVL